MAPEAQAAEANKPKWTDNLNDKDFHKPMNENATKQDVANKAQDMSKTQTAADYGDFKLPEGFEVDGDTLSTFKGVAKEMKLSQEQAQKLVDLQTEFSAKQNKMMMDKWSELQNDWRKQSEAEFTPADQGVIKQFWNRHADSELKEVVENTGLGNNPAFLRFLSKLARSR